MKDHIPLLVLIYRSMNDGARLSEYKSTLKTIAGHQLEDRHPSPHVSTTVFNVLRAASEVLCEDMGYITPDQFKLIDYLIDKNDVSIGAAFEVYLQNQDLEDLVHSLLTILKVKHFSHLNDDSMVDLCYKFGYRHLEKTKSQEILKKLPDHIDKESLFVSLMRTRTIIDAYQDLVESPEKESLERMRNLANFLLTKDKELRQGQKKFEQELLTYDPNDRKPSIKEIHDEIEMLMAEHKEELVVKDPSIFKEVATNEDMDTLALAYDEASKLSASYQIAQVLNSLIEGYYKRKSPTTRTTN